MCAYFLNDTRPNCRTFVYTSNSASAKNRMVITKQEMMFSFSVGGKPPNGDNPRNQLGTENPVHEFLRRDSNRGPRRGRRRTIPVRQPDHQKVPLIIGLFWGCCCCCFGWGFLPCTRFLCFSVVGPCLGFDTVSPHF